MTLWTPPIADPLTTHRVESWWVDVLTSDDAKVAELDGTKGGSITQNVYDTISGSGYLTVDEMGQKIDWLTMRLQPWWKVEGTEPWPLGVFLPSVPQETHQEAVSGYQIDLLDKLVILDQDELDGAYSIAAGGNVTDEIKTLITNAGETRMAITDSVETLTDGMVFPVGTTVLQAINLLLAKINYFSLRADGYGYYVAEPYIRPQDRGSSWNFFDGPKAVHLADVSRKQDLVGVPNKVTLISVPTFDTEAMVASATNEDPASPFSYPSRGRWISHTQELVDATSLGVLQGLAERRLTDLSDVSASLRLSHAALPRSLNEAVEVNTGRLVPTMAVIQKMVQPLKVGGLTRTKLREVVAS